MERVKQIDIEAVAYATAFNNELRSVVNLAHLVKSRADKGGNVFFHHLGDFGLEDLVVRVTDGLAQIAVKTERIVYLFLQSFEIRLLEILGDERADLFLELLALLDPLADQFARLRFQRRRRHILERLAQRAPKVGFVFLAQF